MEKTLKKDRKEYYRLYREANKDKINKRNRTYERNTNKQRVKEYTKKYQAENKEKIKEYNKNYVRKKPENKKSYREANKEKIREYNKQYVMNRYNTDPLYKLKHNLRTAITKSIIKNNYTKKSKTFDILGCTHVEFKQHLEHQFLPWMSWDNYGLYNGQLNYGWDIDHVIPLSSAVSEEDVLKLNHYSNLKPLCSKINRDIKRAKR